MNYFKRNLLGRGYDEHGVPSRLCLASIFKSPKAPAIPDPNVVSQAQTQSNKDTASYNNAIEHGNTFTPLGSQTYTGRVDPTTGAMVYDQTVSLAPDQQKLLDQQNAQDLAIGNTAQGMLGRVDQSYAQPMDMSGIPAMRSAPTMGQYNTSIDMNGLPELFGADDLMGARQQVQDALYQQQAKYLDPQYAAREQQMNTELANKGVTEGSEAWRNSRDQYQRERESEYSTARNSAIAGGGSEMGLLAGIASNNRGQIYDERRNNANFGNFAIGAGNADAMDSAGFDNNARQQALSEAMAIRNQPLNEFNALRTASQVNMPQFQNANNATAANTDVSGNTWNAANMNMDKWSTVAGGQSAQNAALMQGLFSLGSSFIGRK